MPLHNHPRYKLQRQLGHGGFSTVYKAWDEQRREWVAVKVFLKSDEEAIRLCRHEFDRTNEFYHRNIIRFNDFGVEAGVPFIVMPCYNKGSMQDYLGEAEEEQIWRLIRDVGGALDYIHNLQPPVLHNDLKPDNFLIADNGDVLLSDFGISSELNEKFMRSRDMLRSDDQAEEIRGKGPLAYQAPELFQYRDQKKMSPVKASEIWAFGACLYEIATGEAPFGEQGGLYQLVAEQYEHQSLREILAPLPSRFSGALNNLIFDCLSLRPWDRPQAKSLHTEAERRLSELTAQQFAPTPPMLPPTNFDREVVYGDDQETPVKGFNKRRLWTAAAFLAGVVVTAAAVLMLPLAIKKMNASKEESSIRVDSIEVPVIGKSGNKLKQSKPAPGTEIPENANDPIAIAPEGTSTGTTQISKEDLLLANLRNKVSNLKTTAKGMCRDRLIQYEETLEQNPYDVVKKRTCAQSPGCGFDELQQICGCEPVINPTTGKQDKISELLNKVKPSAPAEKPPDSISATPSNIQSSVRPKVRYGVQIALVSSISSATTKSKAERIKEQTEYKGHKVLVKPVIYDYKKVSSKQKKGWIILIEDFSSFQAAQDFVSKIARSKSTGSNDSLPSDRYYKSSEKPFAIRYTVEEDGAIRKLSN